eukprot:742962-Hanusia_phi.AAC.2
MKRASSHHGTCTAGLGHTTNEEELVDALQLEEQIDLLAVRCAMRQQQQRTHSKALGRICGCADQACAVKCFRRTGRGQRSHR